MAGEFEEEGLHALQLRHVVRDGPGLRPDGRVAGRRHVVERNIVDAREALDHVQVLVGAADRQHETDGAGIDEAPRLDYQGVPFPVAARIAAPLAERKMRPAVQRDDARFVNHLLVDDHVVRRLEDLDVPVVAARQHGRTLLRADDAALGQGAVFGAVGNLHGGQQVAPPLLPFRGQGRHAPVRRIDHERRLPGPGHLAAALVPDLVEAADGDRRRGRGGIGCARNLAGRLKLALLHVVFERALLPPIAGRCFLYLRRLFLRQRGAIGEFGGPFQRSEGLEGPDALQVGMTERGPQGCVATGGRSLRLAGGGAAARRCEDDDRRRAEHAATRQR